MVRISFFLSSIAAFAGIAADGHRHYTQLKKFELASVAEVQDLTIRKDRIEIHLDGKLYLEAPVAGKVRGAVFVGAGRVKVENPPAEFEKANLQRLMKVDSIDTSFQTAVFRINGGFLDSAKAVSQAPSSDAKDLAAKFEEKLLKKTGLNVSARIARAIVNEVDGEFLLAEFDKGPMGRFSVLFDDEGQVPSGLFGLNAGERGLVFRYVEPHGGADIVLAFLPKESYETGRFQYSDVFQAIDVQRYSMKIDAMDVGKRNLHNEVTLTGRHLRPSPALFLQLNQGLGEAEDDRRKRSVVVTKVDGGAVAIQEPWEEGVTVFLDKKPAPGQPLQLTLSTEGKPIYSASDGEYLSQRQWYFDGLMVSDGTAIPEDLYYPAATTSWYPNNGLLDRAQFQLEFVHRKGFTAIAVGLLSGTPAQDIGDGHFKTVWRTERELGFASFGVGRFDSNRAKAPKTGVEVDYYSPVLGMNHDKQELMMTELTNGIDFYSELFGAYPYGRLKGVFHPRPFGQGFSSMVMLPPMPKTSAAKWAIGLVSHEVSHQWWGNIVGWRSYRDQWLSEGFAEYSSLLYLKARYDPESLINAVRNLRTALIIPPVGAKAGLGKGRIADIGPMILGMRLATTETLNGYTTLTYAKGGLVLRMIHFLLSNPADGNDTLFYEMLRDFVKRYQDRPASTEDFANVAGEYFAKSPIGRKYSFRHLGWFFRQWVFQAHLPSYRLEYRIKSQPDGRAILEGTLYQEGVPDNWEMPLPVALHLDKGQVAKGSLLAKGPSIAVSLPLPAVPKQIVLNPDHWVLCDRVLVKRLD